MSASTTAWGDLINVAAPIWIVAAALGAFLAARLSSGTVVRGAWLAAGAVFTGLVLWLTTMDGPRASIGEAAARTSDLRIMTFNVWRDNAEPDGALALIRAVDADVVLLQETEGEVGQRLDQIADLYPYRTPCGPGRRCGLTILSKRPLLERGYRFRDVHGVPIGPGVMWADTTARDGAPFRAATIHYPWPIPVEDQARVRESLAAAVTQIDPSSLIIAGDMNLPPWTVAMRRQDGALKPLTRRTHGLATWPAFLEPLGRSWPLPLAPIDHLYAGPEWRTVAAERLRAAGSDHRGLLLVLRRTGPQSR